MTGPCRIERMCRRFPFLLTVTAVLAVSPPFISAAEEEKELDWYAIEVIVFERTSEAGRNAEAWPSEPGLPGLADAVELSLEGLSPEELAGDATPGVSDDAQSETQAETEAETPVETPLESGSVVTPVVPMPRAFQLVPEDEYRLTDAWKRLQASSAYRPLLHTAWFQPGYPSEEARLVHVRNDNAALGTVGVPTDEAVEESVDKSADERVETPPVGHDPGFEPTFSPRITVARDPSKAALDGTLRVHRARYLHVEADLLYYRPVDGDASVPVSAGNDPDAAPLLDSPDTALIELLLAEDDRAPRLFRLNESRRMRSRELHYLDHPMFGMLVEVWPVELPEAPAAAIAPTESGAPADEAGATPPPTPEQGGSGG